MYADDSLESAGECVMRFDDGEASKRCYQTGKREENVKMVGVGDSACVHFQCCVNGLRYRSDPHLCGQEELPNSCNGKWQ